MSTPLSSEQAIDLLRKNPTDYTTPERLRELATQVDANSTGRVTVLYSGQVFDGMHSTDIIDAMLKSGDDVRVINKSQAAKFLGSDDFFSAVAKAYDVDDFRPLADGSYRGPATEWLYHATEGPWADASARFVDKTVGEVRVIASDADPSRVLGATELPHALNNTDIPSIEGIPRETLVARQTSHGTQAAFEMVVAQSHENVGQLRIAVNYAGTPLRGDNGQIQLDSRSYFHNTSIEGKAPAFAEVTRPLADSMKLPNQYVQAGQQHIDAAHRVRSSAPRRMFHSKPTSPTVRKCMPHAMPTIKKTVRHGRHPMLQHMFWDAHLMALIYGNGTIFFDIIKSKFLLGWSRLLILRLMRPHVFYIFVILMMPGCILTSLNQSSVNPQENIPMNSSTQMHSLSAEEISLRMLKLIDRIKTHQDINAEHINSVIGVRLVPNADQAKYLSFAQILNAQWWYGLTLNSDPKDTKLVFNFNTTAGVAEDVAATAICVIDFDHYVSALKTMGFEGNITYGEHGRILNWSFYRDGINVQVTYRGESNDNVDHKCVSSIVIN